MRTSTAIDVIARVLSAHIGETTARAAVAAHCRKGGVDERRVFAGELEPVLEQLRIGLNVFVGRALSAEAVEEARQALRAVEEAER